MLVISVHSLNREEFEKQPVRQNKILNGCTYRFLEEKQRNGNDDSGRADKACVLDTHKYMGTVMLANGNLVFHVYGVEILPAPVKKPEPPKEKIEKKVAINNPKEATFSGTITMINPDVLRKFLQ